jgi:hypothetical protein
MYSTWLRLRLFRRARPVQPAVEPPAHSSHQDPSLPARVKAIRPSSRQETAQGHRLRRPSRPYHSRLAHCRSRRREIESRRWCRILRLDGQAYRSWDSAPSHPSITQDLGQARAATRGRPIPPHGTSRITGSELAGTPIGLAGMRRRCDNPSLPEPDRIVAGLETK